jgi:hypothetical protein
MATVKRFNWVRQPTAWQSAQAWRGRHAKATQQSLEYGTAASNAFASAQINLTTGMATNVAKLANQRVQSQAAAARNQLNSAFGSINTLA